MTVDVNFWSFVIFGFVEEDSDEIKIGTSCKNGGCTKVSERVTVKLGRHSGLNSHAAEMCKKKSPS